MYKSSTNMEAKQESTDDNEDIGFTLRDDQAAAVNFILANFDLDIPRPQWIAADRGWGKTFAGVYMAWYMWTKYGMKALLICPRGEVESTWVRMLERAGVPHYTPISWHMLAGNRGKLIGKQGDKPIFAEAKLNHPWLVRDNEDTGPFYATVEFQDALRDDGIFLIADEFAAAKNSTSARSWALIELIQFGMACVGGKFRCLLLSALFAAEEKNYENLYRILNVVNGKKTMMTINKKTQVNHWIDDGLGEIVKLARTINRIVTNHILDETAKIVQTAPGQREDYKWRMDAKRGHTCMRKIWEQVLLPLYQPYTADIQYQNEKGVPFKFIKRNGFFELPPEEADECQAAIHALKRANIIDKDNRVNAAKAKESFAIVQNALMALAHAKTPGLLREAIKTLKSNPTSKVILICPFLEDQNFLAANLKMYGAVLINGKIKFADRSANIALFNKPTLECRVIIITPEAGGIGVSLHDHIEPTSEQFRPFKGLFASPQECVFPRHMFAISNFNYLYMFQAYGRAYRANMRSDVFLTVFYAANASVESVLINTLMKSKVAKGTNLSKEREYPDEFEVYVEMEGPEADALKLFLENMRKATLDSMKAEKKN